MSQIAQISRRSPLQNPADLLEKRMARDGWKSNIFSFTVKKCLSQKCQPKSIRGSTSQLNWAFFCYFAIPKPRSYNTLVEILAIKRQKKGRHTLQKSQQVPRWKQQQFLNCQCLLALQIQTTSSNAAPNTNQHLFDCDC